MEARASRELRKPGKSGERRCGPEVETLQQEVDSRETSATVARTETNEKVSRDTLNRP